MNPNKKQKIIAEYKTIKKFERDTLQKLADKYNITLDELLDIIPL